MQEFGFVAKDEEDVRLVIQSNNGSDKGIYLEHAKKMDRPILVQIQGDSTSYKYISYALTVDEARNLVRELNRMLDYLE